MYAVSHQQFLKKLFMKKIKVYFFGNANRVLKFCTILNKGVFISQEWDIFLELTLKNQ